MTSDKESPGNQRRSRVSLRQQATNSATGTASAADDALRYVLERRLRKREGREPPALPRGHIGTQSPTRIGVAAVTATAARRIGEPQWLFRVAGFCILTVVITGGVLKAVWTESGKYAVTGTLLFAGKPLPNATLDFYQSSTAGLKAEQTVATGTDGCFQSASDDPLKAGMYAIVVKALPPGRSGNLVPAIYHDPATTPLRMHITENLSGVRLLIRK